jgi:diaminopimelate epimerase
MRIDFLKMQGLGNDFLVFDAAADAGLDSNKLRALADRRTGIGFDQALMLEPPRDANTRAPELGRDLVMGSPGGAVHARVLNGGMVSVDMGVPNFDPRALPMEAEAEAPMYSLNADGANIQIGAVSIGNPHAVLRVPDIKTAPLERIGPSIEKHPRFPKRTNVGFMQIVDRGHIRLRVFERGVGETLACGTGACAAAAVGRRHGLLDEDVQVDLPGGTAMVSWPAQTGHVWLTGPATTVFTGSIDI